MTKSEKVFFWGALAIFVVIVLGFMALMTLAGCAKGDEIKNVLPTVPPCAEAIDAMVTCHDWAGVRPDREFQRAKVEKSENPRFCFVGDVCFYGCPR